MVSLESYKHDHDNFSEEPIAAAHVYLLMKNEYRISRNIRAQWFLNHLNKNITITYNSQSDENQSQELEVVSVIPVQTPPDWQPTPDQNYLVLPSTQVTFLAHRYRFAFCLDLSPSIAYVDNHHDKLVGDRIFAALELCLLNLIKSLKVPGSNYKFRPRLFVTIIAYIPFFTAKASQVLAQGWEITSDNLPNLLDSILAQLKGIESIITKTCIDTDEIRDKLKLASEKLTGALFEDENTPKQSTPSPTVTSPDINTVDMLRFGLLSLHLLPENSCAGLIVITDGIVSMPNLSLLQALLIQLRNSTVSCSFLQVGGSYSPFTSVGQINYSDLMTFISMATNGACLHIHPKKDKFRQDMDLNKYHKALLFWDFQYNSSRLTQENINSNGFASNNVFTFNRMNVVGLHTSEMHKLNAGILQTNLDNVLSCRLREGFFLSKVAINKVHRKPVPPETSDYQIEIILNLPCRQHLNIEYKVTSPWPLSQGSSLQPCNFDINFSGQYAVISEVIHFGRDKTALKNIIKNLSQTDQLLVHLHSFTHKEVNYTIPESQRLGIPLFQDSNNDANESDTFKDYWRPIFKLNINIWQKWMHTHRIDVLLNHDYPLGESIHFLNTIGRYTPVQSRIAIFELNKMLKDYCSFILMEGHSYIKFLNGEGEKPTSFFVILINSKLPCLVIRLAFLGGTEASLRNEIVKSLKSQILSLTSKIKGKEIVPKIYSMVDEKLEIKLCVQLQKPVEKILIRYERMPNDFTCLFPSQPTQNLPGLSSLPVYPQSVPNNLLLTLSRFLLHQRWVWSIQPVPSTNISTDSMAKLLSTITRRRIREGFYFAHSHNGIHTMVKEIPMKGIGPNESTNIYPCIFQFVIFPPHASTFHKDSVSEEEDAEGELPEADAELQIITECWVESQSGQTISSEDSLFKPGLDCYDLAQALFPEDHDIITTLLTLENIYLYCSNKEMTQPLDLNKEPSSLSRKTSIVSTCLSPKHVQTSTSHPRPNKSILLVPFMYDLPLLLPKSLQAELLFSTFFQNILNEEDSETLNETLFEYFHESIIQTHDRELLLSAKENIFLLHHVLSRNRNKENQPFPFHITIQEETNELLSPVCAWRCYAKALSAAHLILVFIPASYRDLQQIIVANRKKKELLSNCDQKYFRLKLDDTLEMPQDLAEESNNEEEIKEQDVKEELYGSLVLPVYCYEATLSSTANLFIFKEEAKPFSDIYMDRTFKMGCQTAPSSLSSSPQRTVISLGTKSLPNSFYEETEIIEKNQLKKHSQMLDSCFCRSFVYALFKCLQQDIPIDQLDVEAVIDGICQESLLEININQFLQIICTHLKKNFVFKTPSEESSSNFDFGKTPFLVNNLLSELSCANQKQLHASVKENFLKILRLAFKPVPSLPNYYFFCPLTLSDDLDNSDVSDHCEADIVEGCEPGANEDLDKNLVKETSDKVESDLEDITIHPISFEKEDSPVSSLSFQKDDEVSLSDSEEMPPDPLFLHFICSVKGPSFHEHTACQPLPTCLEEILSCFEKATDIPFSIEDVSITLDIICLSLPQDIKEPVVMPFKNRLSTSNCSTSSPVPDLDANASNSMDNYTPSPSPTNFPVDTMDLLLETLPSTQKELIKKCITKISWLLQDEIIHAARTIHPITVDTIQMVVDHIQKSPKSFCCVKKNVALNFVYGSSQSLNLFIEEFGQLSHCQYVLKKLSKYYYFIEIPENSKDLKKQPALGEACKSIRILNNPHSDDSTELKKITAHMRYLQRRESDDISLEELSRLKMVLNEKFAPASELVEDETETEDCSQDVKRSRPVRKISKSKPHSQRACSMPQNVSSSQATQSPKAMSAPGRFIREGQALTSESNNQGEFQEDILLPLQITPSPQPEAEHTALPPLVMPQSVTSPPMSQGTPFESPSDNQILPSLDFQPQRTVDSTATSTPGIFSSEADFSSYVGSGHVSTNEDGYEGDTGSDSDGEWRPLNATDTRQPTLPPFWLIYKVLENKVIVYFHMRHRDEIDNELSHGELVVSGTIETIKAMCKTVNQSLLLQKLHETRMCNSLLVPEANEDIWNPPDYHNNFQSQNETDNHQNDNFLDAMLKYTPGTFDCKCIWQWHFYLHTRLLSISHRSGGLSQGIKALRSVLDRFSVNNRKNMFVYQDCNLNVFYLRLFESTLTGEHKLDDSSSLTGSCHSNLTYKNNEEESFHQWQEFRPRLLSNYSDKEHQQEQQASNPPRNQSYITLNIHGISEVGNEIKDDLMKVLQSKLDEAVLDNILLTFSRNQQCKLSPEDVQFIQKPGQKPNQVILFTVQIQALPFISAIAIYIRQNLLTFLYTPKYTDSKPQNHFKPSQSSDPNLAVKDEDVFLYFKQQALGQSGSKGLACILFSVVPNKILSVCPMPSPQAYKDKLATYEYDELTFTHVYEPDCNAKSPGPLAFLKFEIWNVGKIDFQQLSKKLSDTVRHSLWDFLMEYRMLTAPLTEYVQEPEQSSLSEPTTPIKSHRKVGRTTLEQNEEFQNSLFREYSASTPNFTSPLEDTSLVTMPEPPPSMSEAPKNDAPAAYSSCETGELGRMIPIFKDSFKSFFNFGLSLESPSVSTAHFELNSNYFAPPFLKEFISVVNSCTPDISLKVFTQLDENSSDFLPIKLSWDSKINKNEPKNVPFKSNIHSCYKDFIVIGRNINQWKAFMDVSQASNLEKYMHQPKNQKNFQKNMPVLLQAPEKSSHESTPSSPVTRTKPTLILAPPLSAPIANISRTPTPNLEPQAASFIPRQRLLLLYLSDKNVEIYFYNWSTDVINQITKKTKKLILWYNYKFLLLQTSISQKLGLFRNVPILRKPPSTTDPSDNWYFIPNSQSYLEQLVNCSVPPEARETPYQKLTPKASLTKSTINVADILKSTPPPKPLHLSHSYNQYRDLVKKHGLQLLDALKVNKLDLQDLCKIWQSRGTLLNVPHVDKTLQMVKKVARLSHFCQTPILFSPSWRQKLAPVRDHALEPITCTEWPDAIPTSSRSRHSSGSSVKNIEPMRARRNSAKTWRQPQNEAWHFDACSHYIQEYIQYLQTMGFVAVQISRPNKPKGSKPKGDEKVVSQSISGSGIHSLPYPRATHTLPVYYLVKSSLGGLLVLEVGFSEPYAYCYLYSLEGPRLQNSCSRLMSSGFTGTFVDEVDKIKTSIHMHSFTYDYHLRTIYSYISGRQLIFRQGYHLTSFLDDFLKYYQKSPSCAGHLIYSDFIESTNLAMAPHQIYNYIISHNELYGMSVLRMDPICLMSEEEATEFVLVELSSYKFKYKDTTDTCKLNNFDIGLLVAQQPTGDSTLVLQYYILLTSQRDLYPIPLNINSDRGSFRPVRLGSSLTSGGLSSRKVSTSSNPFLDSGEEGGLQPSPNQQHQVKGISDEEVTYLGYFSSQETMMQKLLADQVEISKTHLWEILNRASQDCRRDFLWSHLVPKTSTGPSTSSAPSRSSLDFAEFMELLTLVKVIPMTEIDPELAMFASLAPNIYSGMARFLSQRYQDAFQQYVSSDGNFHHIVLSCSACPEIFFLMSYDLKDRPEIPHKEYFENKLSIVFRELKEFNGFAELQRTQKSLAYNTIELVEDVTNKFSYQLWSNLMGQ